MRSANMDLDLSIGSQSLSAGGGGGTPGGGRSSGPRVSMKETYGDGEFEEYEAWAYARPL